MATRYDCNRLVLLRAQRMVAIQITRCYRMSEEVTLLLTRMIMADIRMGEKAELYRLNKRAYDANAVKLIEKETKLCLLARWAENTNRAAWAKRLLPSVATWLKSPWGGGLLSLHTGLDRPQLLPSITYTA